ncbi:hypothetical protein A1O3_05832 [Capronia epimyces CBS 606.96]|uniref:DUF7708 domain-containing protein n=1 Tax=Capronia epimyces CBS 606.96 TaxID=1182542 RepID=W9XX55_9EURO|nr:uncharacterized protein A1O3_05832 [Capronia epimyces CBS 606.96]EXJ85157.1 hypothetical protein A1O3_05832 [Capronia epimyces CBS 606.96]
MSSPENPFLTSIKAFRQELSDDGRAQFCEVDSAEAMIQHLRTELKISQDSVVYRHLKSLAAVSKSWEPYFEITGILVATKAAIAAPFWGALRLIFQLSRNYEALFEQLSVKFAEISEIVEFSTQYVKLFEVVKTIVSGDKHAMIAALLTIYESVIMFCHRAYSIFAQGKKSMFMCDWLHCTVEITTNHIISGWRKRMAFHAKAAWVPFQDLFVTLIQRLENARLRFDHEVELLRTKVIVDTGDHVKGELEVLERGILELRSSLEAKHYGSTREQAKLTGNSNYAAASYSRHSY